MKRREVSVSLSFLDCICCGFGAIILLFILSMGANANVVRKARQDLERTLEAKLASFAEVQQFREQLSGEMAKKERTLEDIIREIEELEAMISTLQMQIQNEEAGRDKLIVEADELKREIAAMQKKPEIEQIDTSHPVGVPVDSTHVAFVIDSSGSMRDPGFGTIYEHVLRKFEEVLASYPEIKGVQFLDADGRYILGRSGQWLPDSPQTRQAFISLIRRYDIHSNSNPVPGIYRAINELLDKKDEEMKMCVFVLGDEFTETAEVVIDRLDRLNPADDDGKRKVVINAIGFPHLLGSGFFMGQSGLKFSNLMREITFLHGGAFVATIE